METLSNKIVQREIDISHVKEFIRELKEQLAELIVSEAGTPGARDWTDKIVDKLAGDKLT